MEKVDFSPNGKTIVTISVWNLETWKHQSIVKPRYSYGSLYFSPDSQTLALTENFDVQLWDVAIDPR